MARIIVTTDPFDELSPGVLGGLPVLLDEHVDSLHLCDEHAAKQLIERLAWVVTDAERAERAERPA